MKKITGKSRIIAGIMAVFLALSSIVLPQSAYAEEASGDPGNFSLETAIEMAFDHTYGGNLRGSRYYKFTLKESSELKVSFSKSENLNECAFRIYDAMKMPVYEKRDVMNYSFESEDLYLLAGQYYIEVYNDGFMDDRYINFRVIANGAAESISETQDSGNNSIAVASSILMDKKYKGILAQNDIVDYYKFEIPEDGEMNILLQNACTSTISVSVENGYGTELESITLGSGKTGVYDLPMSKGTYYLKVAQNSTAALGAYTFTLSHIKKAPQATAKPTKKPASGTTTNQVKKGKKMSTKKQVKQFLTEYVYSGLSNWCLFSASKKQFGKSGGLKKKNFKYFKTSTSAWNLRQELETASPSGKNIRIYFGLYKNTSPNRKKILKMQRKVFGSSGQKICYAKNLKTGWLMTTKYKKILNGTWGDHSKQYKESISSLKKKNGVYTVKGKISIRDFDNNAPDWRKFCTYTIKLKKKKGSFYVISAVASASGRK